MSRSQKKPPFVAPSVMHAVKERKDLRDQGNDSWNKVIKTDSRSSTILVEMIGMKFSVHNGKEYQMVLITDEKVGCKLGEFVFTRKFVKHGGQKKLAQGKSAKPAPKKK